MGQRDAGRILAVLAGMGGAAIAVASGCGAVDGYDCHELLACDIINEDGTNNGACVGTCVDPDLIDFEKTPRIVWIGPASEQPSCADALLDERDGDTPALAEQERLVAEPERDVRCDPCACTEPACVLPAGLTVTSGWMCDDSPEETVTPFRAPPGWDGACVAPPAVAPEAFGSFEIAPVTARPCEVVVSPVPRDGDLPDEAQSAVICKGGAEEDLCLDGKVCMIGASHLRPGFRRCVVSALAGDYARCAPRDGAAGRTFSERFTFWNVRLDTRRCTPCACTETAPSTCEALVSTFEDDACTDLLASAVIRQRVCHDADPGSALGSMRAEWRVDAPGSCAPSGGELVGELVAERRTLCCLPE
ncbi:hypothetical protein BE21_28315 [Sorangium cellulosum]|uniref:Secreted protein n=1 Tax=Sorangium cellulosum TaxID=56 RepID=A0A150TSD8_SORCE|nr:hypothetical protein BE21_28315 [Sorangium cellulosum]